MINYLKQNHLSLLIVLFLVVSGASKPAPVAPLGRAVNETTTISSKVILENGLNVIASTTQVGALTTQVLTQGGTGCTASSSVVAVATLLSTDFDTENCIDFSFNGIVTGGTVQLPASSTLPLGTAAGSMRSIWIRNATTTAATNVIVTGNTGVLFKVASSTDQIGGGGGAQKIYGDTDGNNSARIDLVRKANSDILANFIFFRDN